MLKRLPIQEGAFYILVAPAATARSTLTKLFLFSRVPVPTIVQNVQTRQR